MTISELCKRLSAGVGEPRRRADRAAVRRGPARQRLQRRRPGSPAAGACRCAVHLRDARLPMPTPTAEAHRVLQRTHMKLISAKHTARIISHTVAAGAQPCGAASGRLALRARCRSGRAAAGAARGYRDGCPAQPTLCTSLRCSALQPAASVTILLPVPCMLAVLHITKFYPLADASQTARGP